MQTELELQAKEKRWHACKLGNKPNCEYNTKQRCYKNIDFEAGDAASEVAENVNEKLQQFGIKAKANMRVEAHKFNCRGNSKF